MNHPGEALEALRHIDGESRYARDWPPYWGDRTTAHHMLGNHEEEFRDAQQARKQNPTDQRPLDYEIRALGALGRVDEIMQRLEESRWLPGVGVYTASGTLRLAALELRAHGYLDAASAILEQAIRWYENRSPEKMGPSDRWQYARILYSAGKWEKAKGVWESIAKDFSGDYELQFWLGILAARQGDREKAMQASTMLQNLKEPSQHGWNSYLQACIAAVLGEKEQAVEFLRESFREGNHFDLYIHRDIDLESLRDYPPFRELLKPKG
jgi:tetratricopeptide (TPR) repeat protein